ncbi:MAG: hypothetical protein ACOYZ6_01460 [Chloroflexota bacterium]
MTRKRTIGILTVLTAAAASVFALTQGKLSAEQPAPPTITPTETVMANQPCAYTWAYKDLPEISAEFEASVKAALPEANAHALAFGEDCVAADGSSTFLAMETDFYVILSVTDLDDYELLGNFIEQVLPIVDGFAPPHVPGPKEGFVEFTFRNGENQRVLRVPLSLGRELRERGLHGAELIAAIESQ